MKFIEKYKSSNFDKRKKDYSLNYIVLHYTAMKNYMDALSHLCEKNNKVSSHFLINKSGDIFYLVNILNRAWHAGVSYWKGVFDINSESIGIELDNSGHHYDFENYNLNQVESLVKLIKYILKKSTVNQYSILGHSDISPYRKIDPGEKFPWKILKKNNLCFLPHKISDKKYDQIEKYLDSKINGKSKLQKSLYMLEKIGYNISPAIKSKKKYCLLIKTYQMHYRQGLINGKLDCVTYKLIQSHYNKILT